MRDFNQVSSIKSDETYALAGCFNYGGYTALYVMNANTDKTLSENASVTVNFNRKVKGYSIFGSDKTEFTDNLFVLNNLAPGEAALIVIE